MHHAFVRAILTSEALLPTSAGRGRRPLFSPANMLHKMWICRMLLAHLTAFALLRALANAGSKTEIRIAMIPMTTSSSTSVKALRQFEGWRRFMDALFRDEMKGPARIRQRA